MTLLKELLLLELKHLKYQQEQASKMKIQKHNLSVQAKEIYQLNVSKYTLNSYIQATGKETRSAQLKAFK